MWDSPPTWATRECHTPLSALLGSARGGASARRTLSRWHRSGWTTCLACKLFWRIDVNVPTRRFAAGVNQGTSQTWRSGSGQLGSGILAGFASCSGNIIDGLALFFLQVRQRWRCVAVHGSAWKRGRWGLQLTSLIRPCSPGASSILRHAFPPDRCCPHAANHRHPAHGDDLPYPQRVAPHPFHICG